MLRARMRAAAGLLLLMLLDGAAYELNLRPNAFILRRPDVLVVAPSLPVAAPDEDEERRAGEAQAAAYWWEAPGALRQRAQPVTPPEAQPQQQMSPRKMQLRRGPPPEATLLEQMMLRYRFLVCEDMLLRLPLEASRHVKGFVTEPAAASCLHVQVEGFRPLRKVRWSRDTSRMLCHQNAGGSSTLSEALSLEVLARIFGSNLRLLKSEMELKYAAGSKLVDYAISLFGVPLGVSVTRAFCWGGELSETAMRELLVMKMRAIADSTRNVQNMRWEKRCLHVWARTVRDARMLERQYAALPEELRIDTLLLITPCSGMEWVWSGSLVVQRSGGGGFGI